MYWSHVRLLYTIGVCIIKTPIEFNCHNSNNSITSIANCVHDTLMVLMIPIFFLFIPFPLRHVVVLINGIIWKIGALCCLAACISFMYSCHHETLEWNYSIHIHKRNTRKKKWKRFHENGNKRRKKKTIQNEERPTLMCVTFTC